VEQNFIEEKSSEKSFGIVFTIFFLIVFFYPIIKDGEIYWWPLTIAVIFFILTYLVPKVLSIPSKLWFKLGSILGTVVSPVVMAFIYFTAVVPIGLIMKLMRNDLLKQHLDKRLNSYWIERGYPVGTMKNQF